MERGEWEKGEEKGEGEEIGKRIKISSLSHQMTNFQLEKSLGGCCWIWVRALHHTVFAFF